MQASAVGWPWFLRANKRAKGQIAPIVGRMAQEIKGVACCADSLARNVSFAGVWRRAKVVQGSLVFLRGLAVKILVLACPG